MENDDQTWRMKSLRNTRNFVVHREINVFLKYYFYDLLKNYLKIYESAGQFYYPSKLICLKA